MLIKDQSALRIVIQIFIQIIKSQNPQGTYGKTKATEEDIYVYSSEQLKMIQALYFLCK